MVAGGYANDERDHSKGDQLKERVLEEHLLNSIDTPLEVNDTSLAPLIPSPHLSFDSIEAPIYAIDTPVVSHDGPPLFRQDRCSSIVDKTLPDHKARSPE